MPSAGIIIVTRGPCVAGQQVKQRLEDKPVQDQTRLEVEAAVFRRLVAHLRERTDVQNIDLMNLAGFCRNCLSKWYRAELEQRGEAITYDEARELVYGMPFEEWKSKYQIEASADKLAAFEQNRPHD